MRHFEVRRSLSHDTCILPGRTIGNFKANCTISRTLRVSCNWPARCAQYRSIFMTVVPYMARIEANPPRICTLYCTVTGSYDSCPQMEVAAVEIQQLNREKKSISSSPQNLRENEPTTRVGSWVKTINLLHTSSSTAKGRVCVCVCVCDLLRDGDAEMTRASHSHKTSENPASKIVFLELMYQFL